MNRSSFTSPTELREPCSLRVERNEIIPPHSQSPVLISLGLHVLDDLLPAARHHQACQVGLHADHLDVNLVPGNGLEDLVLRPLDVEDEPVNCGVTQSQEESVERNTLE